MKKRRFLVSAYLSNQILAETKAINRLTKAMEKLTKAKQGDKKSKTYNKASAGFGPREEVKGFNFDNLDSSLDLDSHKSVSDSEDGKDKDGNKAEKHSLLGSKTIEFDPKKEQILVKINDKKYFMYIKDIKWTTGDAKLYIIEEYKHIKTENLNPSLKNDQYKLILRQFASELKRLLVCITNELDEIDKNTRQFKTLRKSIKVMSSMIEEIIAIITCSEGDLPEAQKEDFNIRDLCDEVYNMMASKIEEKKLDYIQTIAPELENINISSEKSTIKQILLNLTANSLLNVERGQLKIECMFMDESKTHIKVCVHDEGKAVGKEEAKRINKVLSKKDLHGKNLEKFEGSNLIISKVLTEKLGGKIWVVSENEVGNYVNFTFRVDLEEEDVSFEEELEISDYSSGRDAIKLVPSMHCNEAPFIHKVDEEKSLPDNNDCCSNILLVDDNYFNIEVLQSLIEVQLGLS